MLPKSKKVLRGFISAILSLTVLLSPCLIVSAENDDLTEANANSDSSSLSFLSGDQDIINDLVSALESSVSPKTVVTWATKQFVSKVLGLKSKDQKVKDEILTKLDTLMDGQTKLQESMNNLSNQIERGELTSIIREIQELIKSKQATDIYSSLLDVDKDEQDNICTSAQAAESRVQILTFDRGLTKETMTSANVDIDLYTNKLADALLNKMEVTYKDGTIRNDDIFEIHYQYLKRKYHWENQAYDEWIAFQNQALGTFSIAITIDRLSLLARIEKINEYNKDLPKDKQKNTNTINTQLKHLDEYAEQVKALMKKWEVIKRDDSERYYWVPGHEMIFYKTPNTQGIPQENKNAGVGNTKAFNNAKGLKKVKNKSGNYTTTVKDSFWKPFIRYEGGDSRLVNYDQLNMILKDYSGENKSLYDIFFSKKEGNFTSKTNVNEKNCIFVIDEQKSEITGKSYPLTYKPYLFKADQVYCYGIENSKISKGKLPSPSQIHLCYYHSGHADPKTGDNCVGIGVKKVVEEDIAIVWSQSMEHMQIPISKNIIENLISVSADNFIIAKEDKYKISEDKTQILLEKDFLLSLEEGEHTLDVDSKDAIYRFSFTIEDEANSFEPNNSASEEPTNVTSDEPTNSTPDEPTNSASDEPTNSTKTDSDIPPTGDSDSWKIWIYLSAFAGLTLIITFKKRNNIIQY
ncbi:MAG: PT domain-containing protein [Acutalibacteraceae bacterium]